MYPTPQNILHLNFAFSLVYCVLNVCFGIFVLIVAILMAKLNKRPNRVGKSPVKAVEVIQRLDVSAHRSNNRNREITMDSIQYGNNNKINNKETINRRRSGQKLTLTPVE